MTAPYPFSAIVGCDGLKLALLLNAVNPAIGGVLVRGEKGTAKSTAVRGLAALLPAVEVVAGCPFACAPQAPDPACPAGPHPDVQVELRPVRLVELPVGASEDRLAGSLDLERALVEGRRAFEPGLLAAAHRGLLYVDEVNLLGDHLVDLLLDAAAMGTNIVEREGVSVRHAARFQLVGTMNPEEGELRPQLLDRFGLTVHVAASRDPGERAEVVRRRLTYEADPEAFAAAWADADAEIAAGIRSARKLLAEVALDDAALQAVVAACTAFEVDGLRADIVTARTAATLAAWEGRTRIEVEDVRRAALLALPHRRRRGPFDPPGIDEQRLDEALSGLPGDGPPDPPGGRSAEPPRGAGDADGTAAGSHGGQAEPSGDATRATDGGQEPQEGRGDGQERPEGRGEGQERPEGRGDGTDDGRQRDRPGAGGERTFAAGETFTPALLQVTRVPPGALGRRSPAEADRGRAARDRRPKGPVRDVAVAATLRAAAVHQRGRGRSGGGLVLRRGDLREKVRNGRVSHLVLFVVDASGSMAARRRMSAVKAAVLSLLLDAYQRRDRVGLVTFRGDDAAVALPPTSSVELAARLLADLPTGGRTPLAAGLAVAGHVLAAAAVRDPRRCPLLVLLTDGRATAAGGIEAAETAGAGLAARGVPGVVVDTEDGVVRLGLAGRVAAAMAAPVVRLEDLGGDGLATAVRAITTTRRAA